MTFGAGLYGTPAQIRAQKKLVKRFIGAGVRQNLYGRVFLKLVKIIARLAGKSEQFIKQVVPAIQLFQGVPTDDFAKQVYFKTHAHKPEGPIDPPGDGCGFSWIGPVIPFTSSDVETALRIADAKFAEFQFEVFVELIVESPRTLIALFGVFYDKTNASETLRAENWYEAMNSEFSRRGYPPYRASVNSTRKALDGKPALKRFLAGLKSSVDPQNIVAPGRYGTPP